MFVARSLTWIIISLKIGSNEGIGIGKSLGALDGLLLGKYDGI